MVEEDIVLVLDEYNSSFITYELKQGNYIFKDLSGALFNIPQPVYEVLNNSVNFQFDDITMKCKLGVKPGITAIRFDEKSFFSTNFRFTPHWD